MTNLEKIWISWQCRISNREVNGLFNDLPCQFLSTRQKKLHTKIQSKVSTRRSIVGSYQAGIYQLKVGNINARTKCEIYSKLAIKAPERRRSVVFIVNFFFTPCSSVSIVNFEYVIASWVAYRIRGCKSGTTFWVLIKLVAI